MKRTFLLFICTILFAFTSIHAKKVELADAKKVAVNLYYERVNQFEDGIDFNKVMITNTFVREEDGLPVYYAFDFETGGFVIVSGEDVYTPVIGYSFEKVFPKDDLAYVYASFMQGYADMINYIRQNNITASETTLAEWNYLLTDNISQINTSRDNRDVSPLISIMWNQDSPYNLLCPEDPAGPSGHCYAGCVATAMAAIMFYYRYPINGEGDHSYIPDPQYGTLYVNFEETYYQWNGMMDDIDNSNWFPIAELQYHCGVSINMNYGPNGSGAYSFMVPIRLNAFWRYNNAQYKEKSNYSTTGWINLLKGQIDQGKPLYYSGHSTSGGHAFLCDGYQGNDFHFNFCWSGYGNGYYSLSNVGGYYLDQACVINFYPSDPDYPYNASGADTITQPSGSFTDGSGPIDDYLNNQSASWLIDPQTEEDSITDITIDFTHFDLATGDYVRIYDGPTTADSLLGEFTGSTIPGSVTSTGNKMLITFETDASGTASGFKAEFTTNSPQWCLGLVELTDVSGTFDDGSGTFFYNNSATCMWRIQPEYANVITIYFNYFDTEPDHDVLQIFDGSTPVASFSGSNLPDPVEVTSGSAFIAWSTNSSINAPGWEILYEIDNISVEEKETFADFQIYPNPAQDMLNISFNSNNLQSFEIKLMNITGKLVYSQNYTDHSGNFNKNINLSNLAKGVYILNLNSATGTLTKKVVIR